MVVCNHLLYLSSQLTVDVTNGGTSVLFKFQNNVGIASNVAEIYFDNEATNFFSSYSILEQSGASFTVGANPQNPPGVAGFSADYAVDNTNTGLAGGLNQSTDYITISALLSGSNTFANVISAINGGNYNIALHVRSIGGEQGGSDSYVVGGPPSAVPLPAAGWLFGSALVGLMGLRRKMH